MESSNCLPLPNFCPDDDLQHIGIVDLALCRNCGIRVCLTICPSSVFNVNFPDEDRPIEVYYKQCLECGACRLACPHSNIFFQYPRGGYGVNYNDGETIYINTCQHGSEGL